MGIVRIFTQLNYFNIFPFKNEAARLNHKEVVEEDRLNKMPKNHQKKTERLEKELLEEEKKVAAVKEVS